MLAATAAGAYSTLEAGRKQANAQQAQQQELVNQAAYDKDAAVAQADKIRRAAAQQQSQARAQLAGSGAAVGEGTAVTINDTIDLNANQDAYTALLSGSRSAGTSLRQASAYGQAAADSASASYLNAASSVLATGAAIGKGWKTPASSAPSSLGSGITAPANALIG
ncbi:hypothetical protein RC54_03975 [Herbaspirillum rubrisubalbicans]|uniref:Uncharacterized protein n=1 Tax=Herbaspirillum rubrisubalbicans TaxID=80842 RepID=A0AAD0U4E9_9BURK|nr:hypothetical protein RC54_03975 [Herbaspirillum rubrisubalbicans]